MAQRIGTLPNDTLPVASRAASFRHRLVHGVAAGLARLIHHATWRMRLLEYGWSMVERELATTVRMPWYVRPVMWWRGFLSESWVLYGFPDNDWREYLPDHARFAKTRMINGDHAVLLDDKLALQRFLGNSDGKLLPAIYGTVSNGQIATPEGPVPYCAGGRWLSDQVREHGRLVIKPIRGGGGRGVHVLQADGNDLHLDGCPVGEDALLSLVAGSDAHMISEHVAQHPDMARPFPDTTNTLRVLVMQDGCCLPFIAAAVLRVGTRGSIPTDNWSRGGLCADVCVTSGVVKKAVSFPAHRAALSWHSHHPETGVPITGLQVPNWNGIKRSLIELMRSQPTFRYVGWDIVVTANGYRILEGNNFSNVNLIQVHRPLLRDDRVVAFYRRNGVLPANRVKQATACRRESR